MAVLGCMSRMKIHSYYHMLIVKRGRLEVCRPPPLWRVFVGLRGAGGRLAILGLVGVLEGCWCDRGRLL
jgi:hypothetical protein